MERNSAMKIQALRAVVNSILDFIERDLGKSEITFKNNFYWSISEDVLYAMGNRPELDTGSLADDWEFVLSAFENRDQALPIVLIHVAPLLRALATELPSYKSPPK
jgi:hypothetical protein